jgi:hypothetical protein
MFFELLKLKAKLAGIQDENRENVVRNWALSIAASLGSVEAGRGIFSGLGL